MSVEIITALIALIGSAIGTFAGIAVNAKLVTYRLEQLEQRVNEHNNYGKKIPVIEEQIRVINHRLTDLEKEK